jgi:xanthine phosphoribosyltransferase
MNYLEEKIQREGEIRPGNILKIDHFLNHQIDIDVMRHIAEDFKQRFSDVPVSKILTVEASGIAIGVMLGHYLDVPVVFAKKSETLNSTDEKYVSKAFSFTHKKENHIFVSKPYLQASDNLLIIDDFLADGEAVHALIDIAHQAGATVSGIGIAVEKGNQKGGRELRAEGYRLESLAIIDYMDYESKVIRFRE